MKINQEIGDRSPQDPKKVDLSEFSDIYQVVEIERENNQYYSLRLYGNPGEVDGIPEFEHIIGLPKNEKNKAYLEYWKLRLNRSFINGWFARDGVSSYPENGYYNELNRLYNIWSNG